MKPTTKRGLFGTSGIRGDAEQLFTNQFCFDIGRSFAQFLSRHLQAGSIAIGMDPRSSSPRIKDQISAGLVYEGFEVFDEGAAPIPAMNYILHVSSSYAGSIMVSGSHIKPHLNGIKFFAFKEEILKENEKEIEDIYKSLQNKVKPTTPSEDEIHNENRANTQYQENLSLFAIDKYPKWKVVVDPGDGAQSDTMPQVLTRLGLQVIEINSTIQGEFYSRDTEVEKDIIQLMQEVTKHKADFGIGYDSDGDRVVFVDENSNFIPGDYTGTLLAREIQGDKVVTPINTSQVIDRIGKEVIRTKVGSPYVVAEMKKQKAQFGFEANGGGIFPSLMSRDGGRTTIEILNILSKSGKRLSELIAELPKFYIARDKVDYKWELQEKILAEAEGSFKGQKVEKLDGLKIWLDETTWILFRSSQNAPEFRVFAESDSEKRAQNLLNDGLKLVKDMIKSKQ